MGSIPGSAPCVWSPDSGTVIDLISPDGRGLYSRLTSAELKAKHPGSEEATLESAHEKCKAIRRRLYCSDPSPITRDRFHEAWYFMPPLQYTQDGLGTTFKCCEMVTGTLTSIYCHLRENGSYWTFVEDVDLPHDEIVRRCKEAARKAMDG